MVVCFQPENGFGSNYIKRCEAVYWVLIIALFFIAVALFSIATVTAHSINRREKHSYLDGYFVTPWELKIPFEEIGFVSDDGISLRGWWFSRPGNRVIVGCSGLNGSKSDLIGIGPYLWRSGFNVLLFDFRDRGQSRAALRSAGFFESRDLEAALKYTWKRLPAARIGLIGFSMGAAVALLAASKYNGVRALVADSPFSSLEHLIAERYRRRYLPAGLSLACANLYNRLVFGYRFKDLSPIAAIGGRGPLPVLFIHGENDSIITAIHSRRLYEKAEGPKELWIVKKADHCGAYFRDRDEYCERVLAFFSRYV